MPRLQAPNGYYTATEAKELLKVSYAVVRDYANNGKIKYIIPPGRKQGFYLKKDVDRIVNQITAFMSLSDAEDDETNFSLATSEDLREITRIAYALFIPGQEPPDTIAPEWHLAAITKNPYMDYVLTKDEHVLGYVSMVPFTPENPKIYRCLEVEALQEIGITADDIETFDAGKHIDLYIMGMATNPILSVQDRRKYGFRLIDRFITQLVMLGSKGVIINKIIARGDTKSGVKLLQAFGFAEIVSRKQGTRAFHMNINESGAPVAMQYKEALAEWQQQQASQ